MHYDWFSGIDILQGGWQLGEKVGYCYPSGLEKTLCKWKYVPLVTKGLRRYSKYESYKKFGGIFVVRDGMKSSAGGEELHLTVCFIDPVCRSDLYAPHPVHLTTTFLCGFRLPRRER
jgi:hypothetical protein